jgi:hypothetical protein
MEGRQWDRQDVGREEFEQDVRNTQEQGPAPPALARASVIVPQPQLFDFVEVDFNLEAACVGMDGLDGIQGEIGTEQVPGGERESGDGDNEDAGRQGAAGPYATQPDFGLRDRDCPRPGHGRAGQYGVGAEGEKTARAVDRRARRSRRRVAAAAVVRETAGENTPADCSANGPKQTGPGLPGRAAGADSECRSPSARRGGRGVPQSYRGVRQRHSSGL